MKRFSPQNTLDVSADVKAFIYQQINEFENSLPAGSTVGVQLHEGHNHIVATIEIHSVTGTLIARGVAEDPIEALIDAKGSMFAQLEDLNKVLRLDEMDRNEDNEGEYESSREQVARSVRAPKYRH